MKTEVPDEPQGNGAAAARLPPGLTIGDGQPPGVDDRKEPPRDGADRRGGEPRPFTVAMVLQGQPDSRGKIVDDVLYKREDHAIYRVGREMVIQFADDPATAKQQIIDVASLIPLRNKIQFLCGELNRGDCYRAQIAEALHLGLEGQIEAAQHALNAALDDCFAAKRSMGRRDYLTYAAPMAVVAALLAGLSGMWLGDETSAGRMLLATGGGALGALLSVAIAIRSRSVAADGDRMANMLDGALRVLTGVISAGALYLLLASDFFAGLKVTAGTVPLTGGAMDWHVAVLVGIAAGFLERLVPDILESKDAKAPPPQVGGVAPGKAKPA